MNKKLLLLCVLMMYIGRISAQSEEPIWHIATDANEYIPLSEVSYLLFTDKNEYFSIVKTNSEIITDVRTVCFRNIPLAVEDVKSEKVSISILPNPVTSTLSLQGLRSEATLKVLSMDGVTLIDTVVTPANNCVDVSSLATGVYLLHVNGTMVKFIKK